MTVHISKLLEEIIFGEPRLSRAVEESDAAGLWPRIAEERGIKGSAPIKVKSGILYVQASNSVVAQELSLRKREILGRINELLGKGAVLKDIRFKIGAVREE